MYKHILIAIDGSELADKALEQGLALGQLTGARVTAVTVTDTSLLVAPGAEMVQMNTGELIEELEQAKAESAQRILDAATTAATAQGVAIGTLHLPQRGTAEGIIESAATLRADLIVMGSHGRHGLERLFLGSQAAAVLGHSPVAVLVIK